MVTARIAGLSPGTSPPPVRIPIRPFLVLMRPFVVFFEYAKGKSTEAIGCARGIAQSPRVSLLAIYRKPLLACRLVTPKSNVGGSLRIGRRRVVAGVSPANLPAARCPCARRPYSALRILDTPQIRRLIAFSSAVGATI